MYDACVIHMLTLGLLGLPPVPSRLNPACNLTALKLCISTSLGPNLLVECALRDLAGKRDGVIECDAMLRYCNVTLSDADCRKQPLRHPLSYDSYRLHRDIHFKDFFSFPPQPPSSPFLSYRTRARDCPATFPSPTLFFTGLSRRPSNVKRCLQPPQPQPESLDTSTSSINLSTSTSYSSLLNFSKHGDIPSLSRSGELLNLTGGSHGSHFSLSSPLSSQAQLPTAVPSHFEKPPGLGLGSPILNSWNDFVSLPFLFPDHTTSSGGLMPFITETDPHEFLLTTADATYSTDFSQSHGKFTTWILRPSDHLSSQDFVCLDYAKVAAVNSAYSNETRQQDSFKTTNAFPSQIPVMLSPESSHSRSSQTPRDPSVDKNCSESSQTTATITKAEKRRRNNVAARKYRQKRIDRIEELEEALTQMTRERDELKVQLAKRDGEVELLREILQR
jgi:hypothetical protein